MNRVPVSKAIAVAIVRDQPFQPAIDSARNFIAFLIDLMYGTKERARMTYLVASAVAILGFALSASDLSAMQVCVN